MGRRKNCLENLYKIEDKLKNLIMENKFKFLAKIKIEYHLKHSIFQT